MKAEHRKELHTNALAHQINRVVAGLKSKPDNRFLIIGSLVVLAVALVIGWTIFSKRSRARESENWRKLADATSIEEVEQVARTAQGAMPGLIARYQEARVQLEQGLKGLGSPLERDLAVKKVQEAGQQYERLAEDPESQKVPLLVQEALMNAGKAKESLGDLDGALVYYEKLTQTYGNSAMGKLAEGRAQKIRDQRSQIKSFYSKLDELASRKISDGP